MPPGGQIYRLLPLAVILGVSFYAAGFWFLRPLCNPCAADYQGVEEIVRGQWRPGDLLAAQPWWAARVREYLGDLAFLQTRDLSAEDLSRFGRIWVVALRGRHRLGGPFVDGTYHLELEEDAGGLQLRRYRLPPPARVLYDFREKLPQARVRVSSGGVLTPCNRWTQDRWHCSPNDWEYIGPVIVDMGAGPREVIWAHPHLGGPLEIAFERVPGGRTLYLRTGFIPDAVRAPEDAPVTLVVSVDGRQIGRVVQQDRGGFFPHSFDLSGLGPGPHAVTFRVSCPRPHLRIFCFDGEVRE